MPASYARWKGEASYAAHAPSARPSAAPHSGLPRPARPRNVAATRTYTYALRRWSSLLIRRRPLRLLSPVEYVSCWNRLLVGVSLRFIYLELIINVIYEILIEVPNLHQNIKSSDWEVWYATGVLFYNYNSLIISVFMSLVSSSDWIIICHNKIVSTVSFSCEIINFHFVFYCIYSFPWCLYKSAI